MYNNVQSFITTEKRRENIVISFKQLLTFTWKCSQKNGYYLKKELFSNMVQFKKMYSVIKSLFTILQSWFICTTLFKGINKNLTLVYLTGENLKPESCIAIQIIAPLYKTITSHQELLFSLSFHSKLVSYFPNEALRSCRYIYGIQTFA